MSNAQENKLEIIYVTEFKNQFDVWQVFHAFRNKDKAHVDAGINGKVLELVEHSTYLSLQAENEKLKQANKKLRDALISIEEFWNRDANEQAMQGACWHAVETAAAALSEAAEIEGE